MSDPQRSTVPSSARAARRAWVPPIVRSLRAGAAEDGAGTNPDVGQAS